MRILPLLITIAISTTVLADAIELRDGTRLEGTIRKVSDGWQITSADGKVTIIASKDVRAIELGTGRDSPAPQVPVDPALASLRRSIDAIDDINQIIERFERFIANAKDPGVAEEARRDLARWSERREQGLVKQGGNWMTPQEAAQLQRRALSAAEQAREQMRVGRLIEAESSLAQALDLDASNPAALYLRGVMQYRQDKLLDARKTFESVNSLIEKHAPTLNNLAVIVWRQNQQMAALNLYDQAMLAQPVNRFILDNVAEALGTLSEEHRKSRTVDRIVRRFTEQDTLLQRQMSPHGWFRWGSTWVDQRQLDELKVAEREIRDKVAQLESEFTQDQRRIAEIDAEIARNEADMRDIQARSVGRDRDGNLVYIPLPGIYHDLKRENDRLRAEQSSLRQRMHQLRETARQTQRQLPTPQYTGVQQLVGIEGAPLLAPMTMPPNPTTAPAEVDVEN